MSRRSNVWWVDDRLYCRHRHWGTVHIVTLKLGQSIAMEVVGRQRSITLTILLKDTKYTSQTLCSKFRLQSLDVSLLHWLWWYSWPKMAFKMFQKFQTLVTGYIIQQQQFLMDILDCDRLLVHSSSMKRDLGCRDRVSRSSLFYVHDACRAEKIHPNSHTAQHLLRILTSMFMSQKHPGFWHWCDDGGLHSTVTEVWWLTVPSWNCPEN